MTDAPANVHAFVSGECVVKPPDADEDFPWLSDNMSGGRPMNAIKTTCLPGGEVRLQWYANADCSDEITGASVDDALSQVFSDMMAPQLEQMPGVADCMEISTGFDNYNRGMANGGCDVLLGMVFDQVNRCIAHRHRDIRDSDALQSVAAPVFLVSLSS